MRYLADDTENPEHIRHKIPISPTRDSPYGTPARWYRIHVDYVPHLLALCDYYVHPDTHTGDEATRTVQAQWWRELQILLMEGIYIQEDIVTDIDDAFCAKIAACIDSGALDDTLMYYFLRKEGLQDPRTIYPSDPAGDIVLIDSCDKSACYAIVTQLVDFLHKIILDSLESLSAKFNSAELTAGVIAMAPGIGALPFDDIIAFTGIVVDVFASNYAAAYNTALRQQYICDLWCETVKSCQLDIRSMAKYFFSRFTDSVLEIDMKDFAELILQGTFSGEEIVHAMHGIAAYTLHLGQAFASVSPVLLLNIMKSMWNDSDDDWMALCPVCDTSTHVLLNFAESPYDFSVAGDSKATWNSGDGFTVYGRPDTDYPGARIEINLPGDYGITQAKVTLELRWGSSDNSLQVQHLILTDNVTPSISTLKVAGQNGLITTKTITVSRTVDTRRIEVLAKAGSKYSGSYCKIRKLELWFEGQPPYGWPTV